MWPLPVRALSALEPFSWYAPAGPLGEQAPGLGGPVLASAAAVAALWAFAGQGLYRARALPGRLLPATRQARALERGLWGPCWARQGAHGAGHGGSVLWALVALNLAGLVPRAAGLTTAAVGALGAGAWAVGTGWYHGRMPVSPKEPSVWVPGPGAPYAMAAGVALLEAVAQGARWVSLGMRLAANLACGHVLVSLGHYAAWSAGSGPGVLAVGLVGYTAYWVLEVGVGVLQGYVLSLLWGVYSQDTL